MVWRKIQTVENGLSQNLTSNQYSELWQEYHLRAIVRWILLLQRVLKFSMRVSGSRTRKESLVIPPNLSGEAYGDLFQEKSRAGFRLVDMEAYLNNGALDTRRFGTKSPEQVVGAARNMTRDKYLEEVANRGENGFMVVDFDLMIPPMANGKQFGRKNLAINAKSEQIATKRIC